MMNFMSNICVSVSKEKTNLCACKRENASISRIYALNYLESLSLLGFEFCCFISLLLQEKSSDINCDCVAEVKECRNYK